MAKKSIWTEQNKKKVAVGAVLVCFLVIIYEFFLSGGPTPKPVVQSNSPRTSATPSAAVTPTPKASRQPTPPAGSAASKEALLQEQLMDLTPLMLTGPRPAAGAETERGNIFAYYVPPPPPPPQPPKPPPILLRYVQPQMAVAGTPKSLTLVIAGDHFPPDAQVFYGGMPKPTKKSEGVLGIDIAPGDYSVARTVPIEVRSQSKPTEYYSNSLSFMIQAPPPIPFKMVGRIGNLAVLELPGAPNKEFIRLPRGETVMQFWRIDAMDENGLDVTDLRYDIKMRVPLQEKR
jgi:hypothetical protein